MNHRALFSLLLSGVAVLFPLGLLASAPIILPVDDPEAVESHRVIWATEPGIRYELMESTDLENWTRVAGFPTEAEALAQQHVFELDAAGEPRFFKVHALDEQPPEIVSKSPRDGAFGVGRFSVVTVEIADVSGVDPESLSLTMSGQGSITLGDPALSFEDGVLVYDLGGDLALGAFGETLELTLSVADPLGNAADYTWSFDLELEPVYVEELFIFGSPDAQQIGQEIGAIPTRAVAQRWAGHSGPIRMNADADPWRLAEVAEDRLVIEYDGVSPAPHFAAEQYLCNLTPATLDEIFYRRVTSVVDDPAISTLTLMTVDVSLAEIALQETFRLDENAMAFAIDENGLITRAVEIRAFDGSVELEPIGIDWGGKAVFGTYTDSGGSVRYHFDLPLEATPPGGGSWNSRLIFDQAFLTVTPKLDLILETSWLVRVDRFKADFALDVQSGLQPRYEFDFQTGAMNQRDNLWSHHYIIVIKLGWIHINPRLDLSTGFSAGLSGSFTTGVIGSFTPYATIDYDRTRNERTDYDAGIRDQNFSVIAPSLDLHGSLSAHAKLIPELDIRFISLVGCYINIDPGVTVTGSATMADNTLTEAELSIRFDAHLNAGMSLLFVGADSLPSMQPWPLLDPPWEYRWTYPEVSGLRFTQQPRDVTVQEGRPFFLTSEAQGPGPVTYQWLHNGIPLLLQRGATLSRFRARPGDAGQYRVFASAAGQTLGSEVVTVTVTPASGAAPAGFSLIPAGTYARGDHKNESESWMARSRPVHNVHVSAFYMARTPVTYAEWKEVYDWAVANGYTFDNPGQRGSNSSGNALPDTPENNQHPVTRVSWYDVVKWSNAKSEREGLTPVYYTNDARTTVYRQGRHDVTIAQVNWSANGYRLPTEAEWEKAARGGLVGARWPWGDAEIDGTRANYWNSGGTNGTTAVGSYPANGYGLYDMAGNVWEWNWDWFSDTWYSQPGASEADTRGPVSGSLRVDRGGSWYNGPDNCRVARRGRSRPGSQWLYLGFRLARTQ